MYVHTHTLSTTIPGGLLFVCTIPLAVCREFIPSVIHFIYRKTGDISLFFLPARLTYACPSSLSNGSS